MITFEKYFSIYGELCQQYNWQKGEKMSKRNKQRFKDKHEEALFYRDMYTADIEFRGCKDNYSEKEIAEGILFLYKLSDDEMIAYHHLSLPDDCEANHLITKARILRMGWTEGLIKRFLPEPVLRDNPFGKYQMKLWRDDLVDSIMQTDDFQQAFQKLEVRRKATA